jgi:hypothetical protein
MKTYFSPYSFLIAVFLFRLRATERAPEIPSGWVMTTARRGRLLFLETRRTFGMTWVRVVPRGARSTR